MQVVAFTDEPARLGRSVGIDLAEVRLYSTKINPGNLAVFGANCVGALPPHAHHENGDVLDGRTTLLDGGAVLGSQRLALALFERGGPVVASLIPPGNEGGWPPQLSDLVLNLLIQSRDQGRH